MGRYKDYHREPKGGGYDDDQKSDGRASWGRPSYASPSAPQASEPVGATVKWFNAEKGFGFVAVAGGQITGTVNMYKADKGFGFVGQDDGGNDVFVHVTALARAGLSELIKGQRVRMKIGQGQKGLEAQTIELLDRSATSS